MVPKWILVGLGTVLLGCGQSDKATVASSGAQPGLGDVLAAAHARGVCMGQGSNFWSYVTDTGGARSIVTRLPKAADGFLVQIVKRDDYLSQGFVHLDDWTIFWHESSLQATETLRTPARAIPLEAGRAEWSTPRGQGVVRLVSKARVMCEEKASDSVANRK
jgi:hypothetical protein